MAVMKYSKIFCVFAVFICIIISVAAIESDDQDENKGLYDRQKRAFGDSLGYGFLEEHGNNLVQDSDGSIEDKGSHIDEIKDKSFVGKRSASGSDVYGILAGISGGSVIHTDKDNISSAVDILTTSTLTNPVILTRISLKLNTSGQIEFYVDKSLSKLAVEIQTSCCRPRLVVTDSAGNNITTSSPNVTVKVDTATLMYVDIARTPLYPGLWSLAISATRNQDYDVTIRGSSLINFDLDFTDNMGTIISGQPIPGSNSTYVKVTPIGADLVSNWTYLLIKAMNGTVLQRLPLGALRGSRTSKTFLLPVVWPNMDVHAGVVGLDTAGNTFTREQRTLVQPQGVRLLLDKAGIEFITSCNKPVTIPFTVTNTGPSDNFTYQITSDNKNFVATVSPKSVSLLSRQTARGQASVILKTTPTTDKTVQIVISVLDSVLKAQYVTKTFIANGVICSDTVTHTYETPSSTSNDAKASTKTPAKHFSFILTVLLSFYNFFVI